MVVRAWRYAVAYVAGMATVVAPGLIPTHEPAKPPAVLGSTATDECPHFPQCPPPPRQCETGAYCVLVPTGELAIPDAYDGSQDGWFAPARAGFAFTYPDMKPAGGVPMFLPGVGNNHAIDRLTRVWVCDFPYYTNYGGECSDAEQYFDSNAVHWAGKYDPDAGANLAVAYRSRQPFIYRDHVHSADLTEDEYFGAAACGDGVCRAVFEIECGRNGQLLCALKIDFLKPEVRVWGLIPIAFSDQAALLAQADEAARRVVGWYRNDPQNPEVVHYLKEFKAAQ